MVEVCSREKLVHRENWYLDRFKPLLNVLMRAGTDPRATTSLLTRSKISASLIGRKDSEVTRTKKSESRKGILNPFYGVGPGKVARLTALEKRGIKVYAYEANTFTLVNDKPFPSVRATALVIPVSATKLTKILDSHIP